MTFRRQDSRPDRSGRAAPQGGVDGGCKQRQCRHKSPGSPVHRAGGPLSGRQDHAPRSDPGAHRRDPAAGHGGGRHHRRRRLQGGPPSQDERRAHRRHHQFHGRQLHFYRLPRLRRIRSRHARGAARGRCRGRGLRGRREEDAAAATDPARARRPQHPALSVPQQDRQGRNQGDGGAADPAAGVAQAAGDAPASDPARTISSPASSISRSSASISTRSTRRPRWCRSTARTSTAARTRASPCWRSSPITTTS